MFLLVQGRIIEGIVGQYKTLILYFCFTLVSLDGTKQNTFLKLQFLIYITNFNLVLEVFLPRAEVIDCPPKAQS